KKCVFQAIIDKVRKQIAGWKERNLSIGGKEVMLKSVAQAMPMYVMNIFLIPDESINEIHRAFNCYWWGNGNKDNPIRWASWESMYAADSKKRKKESQARKQEKENKECRGKNVWCVYNLWSFVRDKSLTDGDESINEIHRAFNYYWWGNGNKDNPIRWASWESMCISKSRGGMGFRHMKAFNKALLAKQCWRLITIEKSLPARILKARDINHAADSKKRKKESQARKQEKENKECRGKNAIFVEHNVTPNASPQVLWSPPSNGVIKINTDGGISSANSVAGIGFVMRCHDGSVLVAGNKRVAYATSVIEIEAYAILWAIQVALSKGFMNVILETDSRILVDAFLHNKELLHIRGLFLHIRPLCSSFTSCSWSFVRRDGNQVAHELASRALYNNVDEVYDGFVPASISSWVLNDVRPL
ncbi:reverse transcriptase, partial [Tanacetum coccineum]